MTTNLEHQDAPEGFTPRRRFVLWGGAAAIVLATAVFASGSTLGLFSSTPTTEANSFTAGTVTLTSDATGACSVTDLVPGDNLTPCTFGATYTGSASAYVGLDVLIRTQPGVGGTPAYPMTAGQGITVSVTDNQASPVTYTLTTSPVACPGTPPAGSVCYAANNLLVKASAFTSASPAVTFSTAVAMPAATGNAYQGAATQVFLTAHAVQSRNQTLPGTCTVGTACPAGAGFSWS